MSTFEQVNLGWTSGFLSFFFFPGQVIKFDNSTTIIQLEVGGHLNLFNMTRVQFL